jgi:NAD(P)-dependent dehydrogenase (short-subunit alcohol dehydrogenase family)
MNGKICMVTGANAGLGKAIAAGLAQLGAHVVLACRDEARGTAAVAEIQAATGNPNVELMQVDLASFDSVRGLAATFKQKYARLNVLVHNAAVFKSQRTITPDGMELMFATNHLGPFLLTNLLLDALKSGALARVITIAAPSTTRLRFDDLQNEILFSAVEAFGATKMWNLLFTFELARRLDGRGVTANVVHPGLVRTNLMHEAPRVVQWLFHLFAAPPERAAQTPLYLASSRDVAGVTGQFFKNKHPIRPSRYASDRRAQQELWDISMRLAQLV